MAKIHIEHATSLSRDDIREKLGEVMEKIESKFNLKGSWRGDEYTFTRRGVDGHATIRDGSVVIDMKLGMVLGALKGRIEKEMLSKLQGGLP